MRTSGFAAFDSHSPLAPIAFDRRSLRENDVAVQILYCGVCHTDLHLARNQWASFAPANYPMVPGHEIVGRVIEVGPSVSRHALGDLVAIGTIVDSCGHCDQCRHDDQQLCREYPTITYNGIDRIDGAITHGGYSRHIVVRDDFALKVPSGLDPARAAPLLCAGITVYNPLRRENVGPGSRVGVVGIGGLGHLAVRFAAALGATVTVISRSSGKAAEARKLGADHVLVSSDADAFSAAASSFDVIIDTIPVSHDPTPYLGLLDVDGVLVIVGNLESLDTFSALPLVMGRKRMTGSPSGGLAITQEMLDFCARNQIHADCEIIAIEDVNDAFERMERGDVRYRFVIDMALSADTAAQAG